MKNDEKLYNNLHSVAFSQRPAADDYRFAHMTYSAASARWPS